MGSAQHHIGVLGARLIFATAAFPHSFHVGIVCLFVTFIGNGTHSSFAKFAGKASSPSVYTLYLSCGMFLGCSAIVAAMGESFAISWPGILGGVLLCFSVTCYINALMLVGIVWCDMLCASAATVTSFLWGKLYFQEPSAHGPGAVVGLVVLLVGICGISRVLWHRLQTLEQAKRIAEGNSLISGLVLAAFAGMFGGSCFAANKILPSDQQGVTFVWTQALGMLGVQTVLVLLEVCRDIYCSSFPEKEIHAAAADHISNTPDPAVLSSQSALRVAMLGAAQGVVLAITNLTTTIAAMSRIGIGVAQPAREAGHILAVLIGTLYFHEYGAIDVPFVMKVLCLAAFNVVGIAILTVCGSAPQ